MELLITILIISILAGLILGVAALAGETAREAQSRHVVTRLHNLLMQHYNTYTTRRVQLRPQIDVAINNDGSLNNAAKKGRARAYARLYAVRELILMEVPDRWSDVLLTDVPPNPRNTDDARFPYYLDTEGTSVRGRTQLAGVYLRRYVGIANRENSLSGKENTREEILANQSAECLYMVITLATGDGEARSLFGESSIGDTDGDGAHEFLDGWGHPISFVRWAPGFDSQIQINANTFENDIPPVAANDNQDWQAAAGGDHEQFDVFRVDPAAFRLVPLIYSAGRDEELGIWQAEEEVRWQGLRDPNQSFTVQKLSPYQKVTGSLNGASATGYLGTAESFLDNDLENFSTDNVHNHLLGLR